MGLIVILPNTCRAAFERNVRALGWGHPPPRPAVPVALIRGGLTDRLHWLRHQPGHHLARSPFRMCMAHTHGEQEEEEEEEVPAS